jgi:hypothetical protein
MTFCEKSFTKDVNIHATQLDTLSFYDQSEEGYKCRKGHQAFQTGWYIKFNGGYRGEFVVAR